MSASQYVAGGSVGYRGCCGFREFYAFGVGFGHNYDYIGRGETIEAAWQALLNKLNETYDPDQMLHIWFVKNEIGDGEDDWCEYYENEELRTIVKAIPGVVHLGESINPNSNNYIDGYMWVNRQAFK